MSVMTAAMNQPQAAQAEAALISEESVLSALEAVLPQVENDIPAWELAFLRRVYDPPLTRYENRLRALDYVGRGRVLDAGAGFGQWAVVMAALNSRVDACDISPQRVKLMDLMMRELGIDNLDTAVCPLTDLPYPDGVFDAVFCYSAVFCTPWRASLKEFHRVLKPGGHVYMTANGFGYQVYLWMAEPNKDENYDPRSFVPINLANTLAYQKNGQPQEKGQIIVEPEEMRATLEEMGFTGVITGGDGTIDLTDGRHPPQAFFPAEYLGLTCCYEVLAQKEQ